MAEWFVLQGYDVRLVCPLPYYPQWTIGGNFSAVRYAKTLLNGVSVFHCPLYIPKQPKTLSRLLH